MHGPVFKERHAIGVVALVLFPLLAAYALMIFAPCDDSYIFAVYAKNLLSGNGLTYNGERVEGFTSTLWVLVAAGIGLFRVPLPLALDSASLVAAGAALLATYGLGRSVGLAPRWALLPPCLLAVTGDLAFYASNGMDTALFTALLAATLALCSTARPRTLLGSFRLPVLLCILTLARPEGAMVVGVVLAYLGPRAKSVAAVLRCASVFAALLLPVVLAKWVYYGHWLPNTYYVKANAGLANLGHGIEYLSQAAPRYAAVVVVLLVLTAWQFRRKRIAALAPLAPAATVFVLWIVYVLLQGGDGLIGARMLVPAIPLLYVMTVKTADGLPYRAASAGVLVLCAALLWGYLETDLIRVQSRRWRQQAWVRERVGLYLRDNFPAGTLTAANAAGIIPYHSEQPTLDMLGLNDEHIAHHGKRDLSLRVGHQAGDGAYILSRNPKVILLGPGGAAKPASFISDREIWNSPGFRNDFVMTHVGGPAWAWVRK